MDLMEFRKNCGECSDEELVKAVAVIEPSVENSDAAKAWIWIVLKKLLDTERYGAAGTLLWGSALWNPEPLAVQRLLHAIRTTQNLIVLGAAAMGKTYTVCCWMLMDWIRDPEFTEIKVLSTSAGHAKSQAFSTLQRLYAASIVPLPGLAMSEFIGLNPKDRHSAITLVAVPQGDLNEGRATLQGFHPIPRPKPHPIFGSVSRVRCMIDEGEEAPNGVHQGVSNLLASGFGTEHVKVVFCTNPRDPSSRLAQLAEPEKGWTQLDLSKDKEWVSTERYHVIRLDGADCPNVLEKRVRYPGFLTWEGYQKFALELGGNSPRYMTFGRGAYPLSEMANVLIPYSLLEGSIGTFIFSGRTISAASCDLAFEGDDRVILFVGKYGNAIGFHALHGKPVLWQKGRHVLQAEQFYELPKERTIALATSIENRCKGLQVNADWVCVDRTGVGTGVADALAEQWSGSIKGIMWGGESGNRKLMAEDHDFACEICDGIGTEMHLRIRKYLEFGYLAISPQIDTTQLFRQLSSRKYQPSSKSVSGKPRIRIEPKREFKKRMGSSPDHGDALAMLCHVCALNGPEKARFGSDRAPRFKGPDGNIGVRERTAYVDFSQDL